MGRLDTRGEAGVRVTANALGPAIAGHRVWFAPIVLDPSAPPGIARIHGPGILVVCGSQAEAVARPDRASVGPERGPGRSPGAGGS